MQSTERATVGLTAQVQPPLPPLCTAARSFDLGAARVLHNNLDGQGPGEGEPTLTFQDVVPGGGAVVNLEIVSLLPYSPQDASLNGVSSDGLGQLSLKGGASVDLRFRFVDSATWAPVVMAPFFFSIFNVSQQKAEPGSHAELAVSQYQKYFLSANSSLQTTLTADGAYAFVPKRPEVGASTDPADNAATFLFAGVSSFAVSYRAAVGSEARLRFSGPSPIVCPEASRKPEADKDDPYNKAIDSFLE